MEEEIRKEWLSIHQNHPNDPDNFIIFEQEAKEFMKANPQMIPQVLPKTFYKDERAKMTPAKWNAKFS